MAKKKHLTLYFNKICTEKYKAQKIMDDMHCKYKIS